MKVMMLHKTDTIENSPLSMEDLEIPEPGPNQVLVKEIACGVCGSELNMIQGDWMRFGSPPKLPVVPGHEIIGRVFEFGENVDGIRSGQLIGMQYLWDSCGKCNFCLSGNENMCSKASVTGETVNGGYSQYILGNQKHIYQIHDGVDPLKNAPMMGAGITAFRSVKNLGPIEGKTVAVVGAGGIGKMAIQFLKLYGARVIAVSRSEMNRDLSLDLGADDTFDPGQNYEFAGKIRRSADCVIVFAPSDIAVNAALQICRKMGTVVLGVYATIRDFRFTDEIRISGTLIGSIADANEAISIITKHKIRVDTSVFPLSSANEALLKLKHGEIKGRAVLQI